MLNSKTVLLSGQNSSNPSLSLIFTNGQLDSRIAFSRASTATFFDATGTLQTAATNVPRFDYGPTPGGITNWMFPSVGFFAAATPSPTQEGVTLNAGIAPDGTGTAMALIPGTGSNPHQFYRGFTAGGQSATTYTHSIYAKPYGYNFLFVSIENTAFGANSQNATFNISNGTIFTSSGGSNATITYVGNGWYRCSVTATSLEVPGGAYVANLRVADTGADATSNWVGNATSGMLVWGQQIEMASTPRVYVPTTTAPATSGATPLGLLIEEGRTNSTSNSSMQGAALSTTMAPPSAPTLGSTAGGTLAATTYYVEISYLDGAGGQTIVSAESSLAVAASYLLTVTTPAGNGNATSYNVFVSTTSGSETLQATVAIGTNWTMSSNGLSAGAAIPTTATALTAGSNPTKWSIQNVAGLSTFVVATGNESGVPYIDYRIAGTPTASGSFAWFTDNNATIAAANGQNWSSSAYLRLVAGSMTGILNFGPGYQVFTSAGGFLGGASSVVSPTTAPLATQRFSELPTLSGSTIAFIRGAITFSVTSGTSVNLTMRIGAPQLEQGGFASSPILTSGTAVTRASDTASIAAGGWYNPIAGSLFAQWTFEGRDGTYGAPVQFVGANNATDYIDVAEMTSGSPTAPLWTGNGLITAGVGISALNGSEPAMPIGIQQRAASSWSLNGHLNGALNGVLATQSTTTIAALPVIKSLTLAGTMHYQNPPSIWLQSVAYWKKPLTQTQLQSVTVIGLPAFDLNFAAGLGTSALTFSRASAASYFDATGMLQSAASNVPRIDYGATPGGVTNWYTHSATLSDSSFATATPTQGATIAPDGSMTGVQLTESAATYSDQATDFPFTPLGNTTYTFSAYFKAGTRTYAAVELRTAASWTTGNTIVVANLGTGTIFSAGTSIASSITSAGNGWYRVSVSGTTVANVGPTAFRIGVANNSGAITYNGDGQSYIYAWGGMIQTGSVATAYIPTLASPVNVGAAPLGLLLEEARTNSIRNPRAEGAVVSSTMAVPSAPTLGSAAGGSLAATTYYVVVTYVDGAGGETLVSPESSLAVAASNLLTVTSPAGGNNSVSYRIYASASSGSETLQATVAIGTNWTEPTSGLLAGAAPPSTNTAKNAGSLPTYWNFPPLAGASMFVIDSGYESGIGYVDVRLVSPSVTSNAWLWFDQRQEVAASAGQVWTSSFYLRLIGGSLTNLVLHNELDWISSSSATISSIDVTLAPTSSPLATQRNVNPTSAAPSGTVYVANFLNFVATGAVDITLRIGGPQLEQGGFPTSLILPTAGSPAATTRAIDQAIYSAPTLFSNGSGTIEIEYNYPYAGTTNLGIFQVDDGPSNDRLALYQNGGGTSVASDCWSLGSAAWVQNVGTASPGVVNKAAMTWSPSNGAAAVTNAGTPVASTAAFYSTAFYEIWLFRLPPGFPMSGYVRRLRYWSVQVNTADLDKITT